MKAPAKVGLVAAGYVGAFVLAGAIVAIRAAATSGMGIDQQGGMAAFGDSLLFLAVFAVASTPPTGAAFFFLRPWRPFWRVLPVVSLAIAATGLAASIQFDIARTAAFGSMARYWAAFAVLRLLAAPLFGGAFLLSALFAPARATRIALFAATAIETAAFGYVVIRIATSPR